MPAISFGLGIFGVVCLYLFVMACVMFSINTYKEDPNLTKVEQGLASKIEFQGHTYVVWSINYGGGMVHDPDCTCNKHIK